MQGQAKLDAEQREMVATIRQALAPTPVVDDVYNVSVTANTDIASDLEPGHDSSIFRVTIAVDTAATLSAVIERQSDSISYDFNSGSSLTANAVYSFDHPVREESTIAYQLDTAATVLLMNVEEIPVTGP